MEKKSKETKLKVDNPQNPTPTQGKDKLSYEQLEEIANKLNMQCKQLYNELQQAKGVIAGFNEIGLLLTILDKSEHFSMDFVDKCSNKIEETISGMLERAEENQES